uniref:Uncharacterized protein n=1 Tax=Physcomitrium patens TaxID=3218 RepID=A0A7I3ZFT4_PHYPA
MITICMDFASRNQFACMIFSHATLIFNKLDVVHVAQTSLFPIFGFNNVLQIKFQAPSTSQNSLVYFHVSKTSFKPRSS